jgi:hypothetical protein
MEDPRALPPSVHRFPRFTSADCDVHSLRRCHGDDTVGIAPVVESVRVEEEIPPVRDDGRERVQTTVGPTPSPTRRDGVFRVRMRLRLAPVDVQARQRARLSGANNVGLHPGDRRRSFLSRQRRLQNLQAVPKDAPTIRITRPRCETSDARLPRSAAACCHRCRLSRRKSRVRVPALCRVKYSCLGHRADLMGAMKFVRLLGSELPLNKRPGRRVELLRRILPLGGRVNSVFYLPSPFAPE